MNLTAEEIVKIIECEYQTSLQMKNAASEVMDFRGAAQHEFVGRVLTRILWRIRAGKDEGGE